MCKEIFFSEKSDVVTGNHPAWNFGGKITGNCDCRDTLFYGGKTTGSCDGVGRTLTLWRETLFRRSLLKLSGINCDSLSIEKIF